MLKLSIFILVIFSHSILVQCEDDFAEFDDVIANKIDQDDSSPPIKDQPNLQQQQKQHLNQEQENQRQKQIESEQKLSEVSDGKSLDEVRDDEIRQDDALSDKQSDAIDEIENHDADKKKPDLKLVNAPLPRIYKWESYYIEIAFVLASFLYLINFFVGSNINHKFAQDWYEHSKDLLKQQFTLVGGALQFNDGTKKEGDDNDSNIPINKKQKGLIKWTESMYTVWNSGRVGMDGLLIEINLLKRQDLFSMALNLLKSSKDSFILRFLLPQDGYENFVFCIAHRSHATKLARDMVDINTFCPKKKPMSQLGINLDKLYVMSELSDVTSFVLDQKTNNFLKKFERAINYIHITDQYSTVRSEDMSAMQKLAKPKRMATFSFNFSESQADRAEFIMFALSLLDKFRRFKLAKDSKQKSDKNRQKITDMLQKTAFSQKQEAAKAKKEELRRIEKERIYNEDDPEKQKRWEKKEAKREQKRNKMRVKQLKVKSM